MKKVLLIIGLLLALFLILYYCGCLRTEDRIRINRPIISSNQVVVQFNDPALDKIAIRAKYGVIKYEVCACDDLSRELWTLDLKKFTPEGVVSNLPDDEDQEGEMEGDYQFIIQLPTVENDALLSVQSAFDFADNIPEKDQTNSVWGTSTYYPSPNKDIIDIAILDTGIIPNFFKNGQKFFKGDPTDNCPSDTGFFGWNFSDNNTSIEDEHGHGTYIAKIISSELEKKNVQFRILPLKIFDKKGVGSYWDIVCAMNYVKKLGYIDMVNASFGYYGEVEHLDVLNSIVKEMENKTLVLASAGNTDFVDTDTPPENGHAPSGYNAENILAVGGFILDSLNPSTVLLQDEKVKGIAMKGSYGVESVDLAAPFDGYLMALEGSELDLLKKYPLPNPGNTPTIIELQGTSYATPLVLTKTAALLQQNENRAKKPIEIKNIFLESLPTSEKLKNKVRQGKVVLRNALE